MVWGLREWFSQNDLDNIFLFSDMEYLVIRNLIIFDNGIFYWSKLIDDSLVNVALWVKDFTGSFDFGVKDFVFNIQ